MHQNDSRKNGRLIFIGNKLAKEIPIFWELEKGELEKNKTWILSISFSETFGISVETTKLIFEALVDPSITLRFRTENFESNCIIYDISEFADTNVIDIGSPDLPMSRMTMNMPTGT